MAYHTKRLLAVVVAYSPDMDLLIANISAFVRRADGVYVWDNSPEPTRVETERQLRQRFPQVVFGGVGENKGISYGLNQGWRYAREHGFDILMSMDQDSRFENFDAYYERVTGKWERDGLCLCGPTPNLHLRKAAAVGFTASMALITSGMLVPLQLLDEAGGYCEDFLVDAIDFDFCYRLREKGYESYMDNESNLVQVFGTPQSKRVLGITVHAFGYSPFRVYGIFRNHIIVWRRYHHPAVLLRHIIKQYFLNYLLKGVLLVEKQKWAKCKAACKGTIDGFRFKLK